MRWMLDGGVLSAAEVDRVIDEALSILEEMGIMIQNDWIMQRLCAFGAVEKCAAAVFPRRFMRSFLEESQRLSWVDRPVSFSGHAEIYQGWYLNPSNDAFEPWTMERLLKYAALAMSLPNVRQASMLGMPAVDGPAGPQPLTEKLVCWKWGIQGGSAIWNTALCPAIYRMWNEWGESTGNDAQKAFSGTVYLVSPMKFAREEAAQYEWFARRGWEVSIGSLGSLGGTAPVTPAGALALQLAESLALNVMRRCFFGHTELSLGNSLSVIDVRTGAFQYGRPEQTLLNFAGAQVARKLGAHYGGHGGLTDARVPGYESAMQKTASALVNGLTNGHGHIAAGLLAVDEVFSPEQMLLDAEMLGYLKRLAQGISAQEDDFAHDTVLDAGWGGHFLDKDHTVERFRDSLWIPALFSTQSFGMWQGSGGKNAQQDVRNRARDSMAHMQLPPALINGALENKLLQIIQES